MTHDEVRKRAKDDGIQFFLAQFVEMHGKPNAKLMPVQAIDDLLEEGAGFAGFAAGPIGQTPASPDMLAVPDTSSYTRVPWQPELARFACDVTVEGEAWPYCPRTILRNAVARAAKLGFSLKMGLEAEFFLVRKDEQRPARRRRSARYERAALLRRQGAVPQLRVPDDALALRERARLRQLRERPRGRERPVRVELRLRRRARHLRPRHLLPLHGPRHGAAARQARHVHAQAVRPPDRQRLPLPHLAVGQGGQEEPLRGRQGRATATGSPTTAYHFIAGLIQHADAVSAIVAPTVNSYKRIGVGAPDSGATWSPAYAAWGGNNRTQMIRVPGAPRIEHRGIDGSANPYLAATAVLAAGPRRHRAQARPGPAEHRQPVHGDARRRSAASASRACRRRSPTPRRSCARTPSCATGSVTRAPSTTATTSPTRSCASSRSGTRTCLGWEVDRYLTLF